MFSAIVPPPDPEPGVEEFYETRTDDGGSIHVDLRCNITNGRQEEAASAGTVEPDSRASPGLSEGGQMQVVSPGMPYGARRPKPAFKQPEAATDRGLSMAPPPDPPAGAWPSPSPPQLRSRTQDKATWSAPTYDFLNGVPDKSGAPEHLQTRNLEAALAQKVARAQPRHGMLHQTDVLIQDMVNATVRELVGVVESLLDRLLREKKYDTIRNMVADLLTTDITGTLAAGHEQLRQREFSRIDSELDRISREVKQHSNQSQERVVITRDMRSAQDDLSEKLAQRMTTLESRMMSLEQSVMPRAEQEERLAAGTREISDMGGRITTMEENLASTNASFRKLEGYSSRHLVTQTMLGQVEERLGQSVEDARKEIDAKVGEVRARSASVQRVDDVAQALAEQGKETQGELTAVRKELDALSDALQRERLRGDAAAEAQSQQRDSLEGLRQQASAQGSALRQDLKELEAKAATRADLESSQDSNNKANRALQGMVSELSTQVQKNATNHRQLDDYCRGTLATKEHCYETAKTLAHHAAHESDETALIEQLRREFEEEQERSRQALRQVHVTRRDLSDVIEIFHETRERCGELSKTSSRVVQQVEDLDSREADHWAKVQTQLSRQAQEQEQAGAFQRSLREEFLSHTELQRAEADRLRAHSTQRYLEQMDKALDLHRSVESVSVSNRELGEAVRSIRLPKVHEQPTPRSGVRSNG